MTTLSVLMSVYKAELPHHLDQALESVWDKQTRKPDEIVLIEDGPIGPELAAVVSRWKDKLRDRLTLIQNRQNLGLTKSLNKGIRVIKSDFIARMDSDDLSAPRRFELQLAYFDRHPEIAILGGSLQEFDSADPCLKVRHYPQHPADARRYIAKASPLAHPSVMMRRTLFDAGLAYDERYRTSQDIQLWFDAICAGFQIANIDDTILHFRRDGNVYKRRGTQKAWNEFRIYMKGIHRLHGLLTVAYVYPVTRLLFRLSPSWMIKAVYDSRLRDVMLNKKQS